MRDDPGTRGHSAHQAHELLSFHLDNLPLAVIEWDSDFRITRWSRHAETLFGWPAEAVIGLHHRDFAFVHPDDAESVAKVVQQLLLGTAPQHVSTNRNLTREGVVVECEWHNSIQLDDRGHVASVLSVVHDITECREIERYHQYQLDLSRNSEARWRRLFAEAATGIVKADTQGRFLYANRAFCDMLGYSEEALRSTDFLTLTHPDDRQANLDKLGSLLAGDANGFIIEKRMLDRSGKVLWCRNSVSAQRDMHGSILSLVAVIEDITAQREAEARQQSLAQRLTRSLENMSDAFFLLDEDWNFSYLNHQAECVLERSADELLGRNVWEEFPEARESEAWTCYHAAAGFGEAKHFTFFYGPLAQWFDVNAYPVEEGLAVYFRTVTEKKRLEAQLQEAQRMEAIGHLTGGMAHDFNNLLTVIMGNADLLCEALANDVRLSPLARAVAESAQRGADLTQRLLAFARRQALDPQATDINRLIRGLTELLRRTLGEQVEMSFHLGQDLWSADIDPFQLESAILNLSINARDAMPNGGYLTIETRNVSLSSHYADGHLELAPGDYVCIAVSDTGTGIQEAIRSRVFEPFFTTKEKGKGTGLGLSMVFGFLKQSAGHVNLYSAEGEGTTIKLYLPRIRQAAAEPRVAPHEETNLTGRETLLVVEDDIAVREYVVAQLEAAGYGARQAKDGPGALAILAADTAIDLLFTDVMMPGGMTGRELAIAALKRKPDLKVIYTSGYTENAIVHNGRLDEGVRFLGKPYRPVALLKKIRETLDED
ncbi:PAS domain S-box protein [Halomonas lysinitropha]|uniref:histidine kinase n=1 Tax=Halomonas lysinitropha TaxID=2607506 RepID=A0A5K1I1B9_9GAMM|nr:PAS domain S-box protein [Halomonas lysinitropha]VVZ95206.1 Blue-light-activated protein [Halomonas lysinitropha]